MATYEAKLHPDPYVDDFTIEKIRELARPVVSALFEDMSRSEAEQAREDINTELASRGQAKLGPLTVRRTR